MNIRIHVAPPSADKLLEMLKDRRFEVVVKVHHRTHPRLGAYTEEERRLVDEEGSLHAIRQVTGCSDVEVMIDGDYRPPGQYPFSRLTVVLNHSGAAIRAFFGG